MDIITNNLHEITGEERLNPSKATVLGPVRVIPREFPQVSCFNIDILLPAAGKGDDETGILADRLLGELIVETPEPVSALRGAHRWAQHFEPIRLDRAGDVNPHLREGGVYLVTGGLGGIGLVLARHLADKVRARLILVGRSDFPAREQWEQWLTAHHEQDPCSQKIREILDIEKRGGEVLVMSADVADPDQVRQVAARAAERFGRINGIIHSAGIPDGGMIQSRTGDLTEKVLAPKVQGTLVLNRLFKDAHLDFFILCSSYSSILGPLGQVAYCAANAYLDSFAHYNRQAHGIFTVSIAWEVWKEVGMAAAEIKRRETRARHPAAAGAAAGTAGGQTKEINHPMFDRYLIDSPDQETFISTFSAEKDWFMRDHIIMEQMTLSGTGYLEMARVAFETHEKDRLVEIWDVFFFALLTVEKGEEKQVRTVLTRKDDHFEFMIKSRVRPGEDRWQLHTVGKIAGKDPESPRQHDLKQLEAACNNDEMIVTREDYKKLPHGPRWHSLKKAKFGQDQQFSLVELPAQFTTSCIRQYSIFPLPSWMKG
jgi:NAD(P)-dependent dehydrogenase (short-subunit alcohol dehydrogenase family)